MHKVMNQQWGNVSITSSEEGLCPAKISHYSQYLTDTLEVFIEFVSRAELLILPDSNLAILLSNLSVAQLTYNIYFHTFFYIRIG